PAPITSRLATAPCILAWASLASLTAAKKGDTTWDTDPAPAPATATLEPWVLGRRAVSVWLCFLAGWLLLCSAGVLGLGLLATAERSLPLSSFLRSRSRSRSRSCSLSRSLRSLRSLRSSSSSFSSLNMAGPSWVLGPSWGGPWVNPGGLAGGVGSGWVGLGTSWTVMLPMVVRRCFSSWARWVRARCFWARSLRVRLPLPNPNPGPEFGPGVGPGVGPGFGPGFGPGVGPVGGGSWGMCPRNHSRNASFPFWALRLAFCVPEATHRPASLARVLRRSHLALAFWRACCFSSWMRRAYSGSCARRSISS